MYIDNCGPVQIALGDCMSSIVYDVEHNLEWKALKLYEKYVRVGAEYEINIPSAMRSGLGHVFESRRSEEAQKVSNSISGSDNANVEEESVDYANIFDECCAELVVLLGYSLSRFKCKPGWAKIISDHRRSSK